MNRYEMYLVAHRTPGPPAIGDILTRSEALEVASTLEFHPGFHAYPWPEYISFFPEYTCFRVIRASTDYNPFQLEPVNE